MVEYSPVYTSSQGFVRVKKLGHKEKGLQTCDCRGLHASVMHDQAH